jgi:hypothetical protein
MLLDQTHGLFLLTAELTVTTVSVIRIRHEGATGSVPSVLTPR